MNLFDFFRDRKKKETPANIAKERLQIIVAHERGQRTQPDYLPALQKELVEVIRKYVNIDSDQVQVATPSKTVLRNGLGVSIGDKVSARRSE